MTTHSKPIFNMPVRFRSTVVVEPSIYVGKVLEIHPETVYGYDKSTNGSIYLVEDGTKTLINNSDFDLFTKCNLISGNPWIDIPNIENYDIGVIYGIFPGEYCTGTFQQTFYDYARYLISLNHYDSRIGNVRRDAATVYSSYNTGWFRIQVFPKGIYDIGGYNVIDLGCGW